MSETRFVPRLRRMRRRILLGSLTVTALGLIVLATAVTLAERSSRIGQEVDELEMLIDVADRLVAREQQLALETLTSQQPAHLAIVSPDGTVSLGEAPPVEPADLEELLASAEATGSTVQDRLAGRSGVGDILVTAGGARSDGAGAGETYLAWISVHDIPQPEPWLTGMVWAISALLLVGLAITTVWLVDRTLRPASFALIQQGRFIDDAGKALQRPLGEVKENLERSLVAIKPASAIRQSIHAVDDAESAVDDLLTLLRLDAMGASGTTVDKRQVRLDTIVSSEVPEGVAFSSAGPSEIVGDESLIRRAVRHMIENAKVHGAEPVEVTVVGKTVTVLDRGPGFGADAHRVFTRFEAGGDRPGVGLGLALVAAVARIHGGTVYAENREEGGGKVILGLG